MVCQKGMPAGAGCLAPRSILKMGMNTKSPKGADFILHAEEKGMDRFLGFGRGSMVLNYTCSVGEYSSYRLVYDNKRHVAQAYTRSLRFCPIKLRTKVALIEGMQDPLRKNSKVC